MPAPVVNCGIQMVFLAERGALPRPSPRSQPVYLRPGQLRGGGGFVPAPHCPGSAGATEGFGHEQEKQRWPGSPGGEEEGDAAAVLRHAGTAHGDVCPRPRYFKCKSSCAEIFQIFNGWKCPVLCRRLFLFSSSMNFPVLPVWSSSLGHDIEKDVIQTSPVSGTGL